MNTKSIYRVVIVSNDNVIWASGHFFTTEQGAIDDIWRRTSEWQNIYEIGECHLNPFGCFEMKEAAIPTWLTVHMIANVTDKKKNKKSIYGVVKYELK